MVIVVKGKKGAEGIMWFIVLAAVALVFLGLVGSGVINFSEGVFGFLKYKTGEMQNLAKACGSVYIPVGFNIDFCKYRLIGNELVNCRHPTIMDSLKKDDIDTSAPGLQCDEANLLFDACSDAGLVSVAKQEKILAYKAGKQVSCKVIIDGGAPSTETTPPVSDTALSDLPGGTILSEDG
ncbi:hypothetical protein J4423_05070 [Candidatus Pacearchaeota archaeon]|nr:hypothetical protein [Candidatus Pacearchaeota archaeon]